MQSVLTALAVLEVVSEHQPIGVSDVARHMAMPKSSAQRALHALSAAGWIRTDASPSARWVLSSRSLVVGSRFGADVHLTKTARDSMERLRTETLETINLMVPDGTDVVLIERLDSPQLLRSSFPLGMRAPMNSCSNGKAVLAALEPEALAALLQREWPTRTEATITDAARLRDELVATRARGFATNHQELSADICAVAAAITDGSGHAVASISISVPTQRMTDECWQRYGSLVKDAARHVSATLRRMDTVR